MRRSGAWSGVAAVSLLALLCMVTVSVRSSWEDATRAVTLEAPLALVDLQPEPAEHSLRPIDFKRNKHDIVRASARFSACVAAAATVDQGVWCMGQLLTVLPRPLEKRALEVAKEVSPSQQVVGDPKIIALKLQSCLNHAEERDGAVFCVSDLLAHVPPTVVDKAVELGEEHPAFDWADEHAAAVHDSTVFNSCVDEAGNVQEGVTCLGSLLAELPEAMVERAVRITSELPPPHQPAEEPQMLAKDYVYCTQMATRRDAAVFCLAHFLGRLPEAQVHEAYRYSKAHRGKGTPFLTDFQAEDADVLSDAGPAWGGEARALGRHSGLAGLAFGGGEGLGRAVEAPSGRMTSSGQALKQGSGLGERRVRQSRQRGGLTQSADAPAGSPRAAERPRRPRQLSLAGKLRAAFRRALKREGREEARLKLEAAKSGRRGRAAGGSAAAVSPKTRVKR